MHLNNIIELHDVYTKLSQFYDCVYTYYSYCTCFALFLSVCIIKTIYACRGEPVSTHLPGSSVQGTAFPLLSTISHRLTCNEVKTG